MRTDRPGRYLVALVALFALLAPRPVEAHESRPGYLELRETADGTWLVLWKRPVKGEVEIRITPVLPESCALVSAAQTTEEGGTMVATGEIACAEALVGQRIGIEGLETTITDVLVRIFYLDGASETHILKPASPTVEVGTSAGTLRRVLSYGRLGVEHILQGVDHLLFVLGLLLLVNSTSMLVKTITSFTVAHSITLALATLGWANAPALPLNAVIALSILFLGPEIMRAYRGESSLTTRHPWSVAFAFGLLHGFGFASGLTLLGIPTAEIPLALLSFNVGVELGQLAFVFLVLALARSFATMEIRWPRWAKLAPAYAIGGLGAMWTIERTVLLARELL